MAAPNSAAIMVGSEGSIHTAPLGSTQPTDPDAALDAAWEDVGTITEEGAQLLDSKEVNAFGAWHTFYAARRQVNSRQSSIAFVLREWSLDTLPFAFGGGVITEPVAGVFRYDLPDPADLDERMLALTWADGTKHYRIITLRGMVIENVETTLQRANPADLPVTFGATQSGSAKPWYLLTDDPAFDATP